MMMIADTLVSPFVSSRTTCDYVLGKGTLTNVRNVVRAGYFKNN